MSGILSTWGTAPSLDSLWAALADGWIKGMAILGLTALGLRCASRRAPALHHWGWALTMATLLLLPLLSALLPQWRLPILPPAGETSANPSMASPTPAPATGWRSVAREVFDLGFGVWRVSLGLPEETAPQRLPERELSGLAAHSAPAPSMHRTSRSWRIGILLVWSAGATAQVLLLLWGHFLAHRLFRASEPPDGARWAPSIEAAVRRLGIRRAVRMREAPRLTMPFTWGIFEAAILLPRAARGWSETWRQAVLCHELAHVRRWDCLTHTLAQLALAWHWLNPLAWFALRRMKLAREQACDDWVLRAGTPPAEYANQLVALARQYRGLPFGAQVAIAMAQPSALEDRVRAILDPQRDRRGLTRGGLLAGLALACVLATPLAAVRLGELPTAGAASAETTSTAASRQEPAVAVPAPGVLDPLPPHFGWVGGRGVLPAASAGVAPEAETDDPAFGLSLELAPPPSGSQEARLYARIPQSAVVWSAADPRTQAQLARATRALAQPGRVTDDQGRALAGAEAVVGDGERVLTLRQGKWTVGSARPFDPGDPFAEAFEPQGILPLGLLVVHPWGFKWLAAAEAESPAPVALEPWGRIEGRLLIGNRPAAHRRVGLRLGPGTELPSSLARWEDTSETDNDGRFVLERVPSGWIEVGYELGLPSQPAALTQLTPVRILPGETASLTLGGKGRAVKGRFVQGNAFFEAVDFSRVGPRSLQPVPPRLPYPAGYEQWSLASQAAWYLGWLRSERARRFWDDAYRREDFRRLTFPVQTDGAFRLEDVPVGKYVLTLRLPQPGLPGATRPPAPEDEFRFELEVPSVPAQGRDEPHDWGRLKLDIVNLAHLRPRR